MSLDYRGSLSLGACMPMALEANVQLSAAAGASIGDVQSRLSGLLALSIQPPPSLPALIASVTQLLAALQGLVVAPLPDVSAIAAAIADLQAILVPLQASIAFGVTFGGLLSAPGIHFYAYAGRADQAGPELTAALGGGLPGGSPGEQIAGALLLARDGAAINALRAVLGL